MKLNLLIISTALLIYVNSIKANNISVNNVAITEQSTVSNYTYIKFDISWDNSWRVSTGPSNWDAAWVFAKYRLKSQTTWNHAILRWVDGTGSGDGHTEPANSDINSSNDNAAGGAYGVFIHSSGDNALGSVNYTGVRLRWNYGVNGLSDLDSVELCVFAIEMVYVPQGSFYAGDGTGSTIKGQLEDRTLGTSKQITSEGALTLGGGGAGSMGNNAATGMVTIDDFNDGTSKSLPAAFPKGYNAFYCMKYEITQKQYAEFLNMLTYTQQASRTTVAPNSTAGTGALKNTNANRSGIDIKTAGVSTSTPAVYACNLDGDGNYNETTDGESIACNFIDVVDVCAYLDWAALRPMTELEYEKASRGTLSAVANEYAWGSASISGATGISNSGISNETASNAGAQCAYNNNGGVQGPMRVGNFGQGVNTRTGIGAGYYGILELSGNNWEAVITVGNTTGRAFTGSPGDGNLDATGNNNVSNWPTSAGLGGAYRGGAWDETSVCQRVSDRKYAAETSSNGVSDEGGRGARTAPE